MSDRPTEMPAEALSAAMAVANRIPGLPGIRRSEMRLILEAASSVHLNEGLRRIRDLANLFTGEADPNYKDQWETGHDAGMAAAGRQLSNLLDSMGAAK